MSLLKRKLSGNFNATKTESLKSILSDQGSTLEAATEWHPKEGRKRSQDIDRYLMAESSLLKRQLKVLILGSTEPTDIFWKQTFLLENPLTDNDREEMKSTIQQRAFQLAREVFHELLDELKRADGQEMLKEYPVQMLQHALEYEDEDLARKLHELYLDSRFQIQLDQAHLSLRDTERKVLETRLSMFLDSWGNTSSPMADLLRRVLSEDYKPTDNDYIHFDHRRKLSSLRETYIHRGAHVLSILDLHSGGGERKKLIHFFENVRCVIFVTDLGTYDRCLGDGRLSVMSESLMLLESVARSKWFLETPIVCVLSNAGAFKRKMRHNPMPKWFPEYQGGTEDDAMKFMVDQHVRVTRGRKCVKVHVCDELSSTTAQDIIEVMETVALKGILQDLEDERAG